MPFLFAQEETQRGVPTIEEVDLAIGSRYQIHSAKPDAFFFKVARFFISGFLVDKFEDYAFSSPSHTEKQKKRICSSLGPCLDELGIPLGNFLGEFGGDGP